MRFLEAEIGGGYGEKEDVGKTLLPPRRNGRTFLGNESDKAS
jgi:hypothetical protein